ncbi:MAG: hypothetical protein QME06_10660 [Desulfobacterales bacterium]|nr:hypothetical protein [Desulfobacterales bacterium]
MKDLNDFKVKYPDIYRVIFEEGKKAGVADGRKQGEATAVVKEQTEAKRRQAVAKTEAAAFDRLSINDKAKIIFDTNASLQAEFRSFDTYLAYVKGVAAGRVKICGGTT